jgi:hypothetical protein
MAEKKFKLTFTVPIQLQLELNKRVLQDGYGMKGKSKWVAEAVNTFVKMKTFVEMVNIANEMTELEKVESITVDMETKKHLDQAILEARKQSPLLEGVQSRIVRASIIQRLIQSA